MLRALADALVDLESDVESREKAARLGELSVRVIRMRFNLFWRDCRGRDLVPHLMQAERALDAAQRFVAFLSWTSRVGLIRSHLCQSEPLSAALVYHVAMLIQNVASDMLTLLDLKIVPDPMLPQDDVPSIRADEHPRVQRPLSAHGKSCSFPLMLSEWSASSIERHRYRIARRSPMVLTLQDALKMLFRPNWHQHMQKKGLEIISLSTICEVTEAAAQFLAVTFRVLGLLALPSHRGPSPSASLVQGVADFVHAVGRAFGGETFPDRLAQWLIFVSGLSNLSRRAVELRVQK